MDPQRLQILVATADDSVMDDLRGALREAAVGAELLHTEQAVPDTPGEVRADFLFVDVDMGADAAREILAGQESEPVPVVALASEEDAAIRLFQDTSGWTPHYTASGVDEGFQPLCFGPAYVAAGVPRG